MPSCQISAQLNTYISEQVLTWQLQQHKQRWCLELVRPFRFQHKHVRNLSAETSIWESVNRRNIFHFNRSHSSASLRVCVCVCVCVCETLTSRWTAGRLSSTQPVSTQPFRLKQCSNLIGRSSMHVITREATHHGILKKAFPVLSHTKQHVSAQAHADCRHLCSSVCEEVSSVQCPGGAAAFPELWQTRTLMSLLGSAHGLHIKSKTSSTITIIQSFMLWWISIYLFLLEIQTRYVLCIMHQCYFCFIHL